MKDRFKLCERTGKSAAESVKRGKGCDCRACKRARRLAWRDMKSAQLLQVQQRNEEIKRLKAMGNKVIVGGKEI